jgi:HPt (histidine-containing phosphotransfer) domain-containing protein
MSNSGRGDVIRVCPPAGIEQLIPEYLAGRSRDLQVLATALARSDYEAIRVIAHNMKGSGSGFGFPPITDIGRSMETAAKEKSGGGVQGQIEALTDYLNRVEVVTSD